MLKKGKFMKVSGVSSNMNFGRVYAVAGSQDQINQLHKIVRRTSGKGCFLYATDIYKNSYGDGMCARAVREGKEVAFVVAGKKDYENVMFMKPGWGSINGVSHHLDRFIDLVDVRKQANAIQKAMKR